MAIPLTIAGTNPTRHPLEQPILSISVAHSNDGPERRVDALGLSKKIVDLLRDEWGIENLFPPQAEALPSALAGKNLMLTIPTASGKSLVAHLTIVHRLTTDLEGLRALYIVPLKALATEKVEELREIGNVVGLRVGLAIGDREGETGSIEDCDILVCTSEKLDSLLRSRSELLNKIGIVVSDEFHLLHDPGRGPTLEVLLSRIRHQRPDAQIIALSATVGNCEKLANWLNAELIQSDWRPVALHSGTLTGLDVRIHRIDGTGTEEWPEPREIQGRTTRSLQAALDDTVRVGGQLLVFVNSRASAQKEARELGKHIRKKIADQDPIYDPDLSDKWNDLADSFTRREDTSAMGGRLANAIRGGAAFHHAGLTGGQRKKVEEAFRKGDILCIIATPTLAQGVNLPARRVVVRDVRRWNTAAGRTLPMPVMEIRQMMGRAGRPKYDRVGDAWLLAKNKDEEFDFVEQFLLSDPEDITSKLANPTALRPEEDPALLMHVLSMISTGGMKDRDSLDRFFNKTFLATHMDAEVLASRIDEVISWLAKNEMITKEGESEEVRKRILADEQIELLTEEWEDDLPSWANSASSLSELDIAKQSSDSQPKLTPRKGPAIFGFKKASTFEFEEPETPELPTMTYRATILGERVSRLYLNPISGRILKDGLTLAMKILTGENAQGQVSPMSFLHLVASTPDFMPLWPRKGDYDAIQASLHGHQREFLTDSFDLDEENRMKGVLVLQSWIEESSMSGIEEEWGVQPGDLRGRVELAEWLLFAARSILANDDELSSMDNNAHRILVESLDEIHRRIRYGCKADLLGLVSLRGVGRVRAREMANLLGVSNAADIAELTEKDKSKLSDLRGWSPKLVENLMNTAGRAIRRKK
ncbi:MAG: DEAD/DEAH box helicase [Euryarchaeota archaeon]|jgi:helicase|nr:DEAD/DEAH box helicase [Euryarchaeota archaeon]MBT3654101.1 DEAD/DEAH box helicase [Euryarchaeota archaeon]MBT3757932.1 DEAD/DEAH box helicase [Euryarchaeota archaeon]MBT4050470.1 DEAD/DEAH box helicase [Euryarchaeota archaeon]MBT4649772.1 DEAD/DEAH box helicase [Euryarchaeota archaeon]